MRREELRRKCQESNRDRCQKPIYRNNAQEAPLDEVRGRTSSFKISSMDVEHDEAGNDKKQIDASIPQR